MPDKPLPDDFGITESGRSLYEKGLPQDDNGQETIIMVLAVETQYTVDPTLPEPLFCFRFNAGRPDELPYLVGLPFGWMDDFLAMVGEAWEDYKNELERRSEQEES